LAIFFFFFKFWRLDFAGAQNCWIHM